MSSGLNPVGDLMSQNPRFSATRAGDNQERAVHVGGSLALGIRQIIQKVVSINHDGG